VQIVCAIFNTKEKEFMYDYANNGVTVASILDNRRGTKKGAYPVKIRVTFNRERKYYSTSKKMSETDWVRLPTSKVKTQLAIKSDIQNSSDREKNASLLTNFGD
jgi:hypothetical protein